MGRLLLSWLLCPPAGRSQKVLRNFVDKLVSIENCPPRKNSQSAGRVVLVFRNGDAVKIDSDLPNAVMHSTGVSTAPIAMTVGKESNTAMDEVEFIADTCNFVYSIGAAGTQHDDCSVASFEGAEYLSWRIAIY